MLKNIFQIALAATLLIACQKKDNPPYNTEKKNTPPPPQQEPRTNEVKKKFDRFVCTSGETSSSLSSFRSEASPTVYASTTLMSDPENDRFYLLNIREPQILKSVDDQDLQMVFKAQTYSSKNRSSLLWQENYYLAQLNIVERKAKTTRIAPAVVLAPALLQAAANRGVQVSTAAYWQQKNWLLLSSQVEDKSVYSWYDVNQKKFVSTLAIDSQMYVNPHVHYPWLILDRFDRGSNSFEKTIFHFSENGEIQTVMSTNSAGEGSSFGYALVRNSVVWLQENGNDVFLKSYDLNSDRMQIVRVRKQSEEKVFPALSLREDQVLLAFEGKDAKASYFALAQVDFSKDHFDIRKKIPYPIEARRVSSTAQVLTVGFLMNEDNSLFGQFYSEDGKSRLLRWDGNESWLPVTKSACNQFSFLSRGH